MKPITLFFIFITLAGSFAGCQRRSLAKDLLSDNPDVRGKALERLGQLPNIEKSSLTSTLVENLKHSDTRIVHRAIDALSVLRGAAVPNLVDALTNPDPFVRMSAAQALGLIGEPAKDAVDSLANLLKDSHPLVREEAATTLGRIGASAAKAVPRLVASLQDESEEVQESAKDALQKIGTKEALVALQKSKPKPKKTS